MTDTAKTVVYAGVALVLTVMALATRPNFSRSPEVFDDTREAFYPELSDPSVPKALEVVAFDEALEQAKPFRVELRDNRWIIPSHNNYPADAADRLKKTAGAIINLKKDSVVSDRKEDHSELGVADPFESSSGKGKGWGTSVKLFDKDKNIVAHLIIGKEVPNRTGFRYVRVPGKDRTYAVETKDLDLSIKFADWIDTKLLDISPSDVEKITIKDYSVNLTERRIDNRGEVVLTKDKDGNWLLPGLKENEEVSKDKSSSMGTAIQDLKIVGVRQKPPGLKPDLKGIEGQILLQAMQDRGYFMVRGGDLVSNDGEMIIETKDGLVYTLRFGGMLLGTGDDVTAGAEKEKAVGKVEKKADEKAKDAKSGSLQENRFLLVSVGFDASKFPPIPGPEPTKPEEKKPEEKNKAEDKKADAKPAEKKADDKKADEKAKAEEKPKTEAEKQADAKKQAEEAELKRKRDERDRKIKEGQEKAKELSDRFSNWFYVISNDDFKKMRLARADLVAEKKKEDPQGGLPPGPGGPQGGFPPGVNPFAPPAPPTEKPAAPKAEEKPAPKAVEKPAPPKAEEKSTPKPDSKPAPKAEEKASPKASAEKPSAPKADAKTK